MDGVNAELGPWLRMTYPPDAEHLDAVVADGGVGFRSWLLAFGVLPFDRHSFALVSLDGTGFVEESRSWLQRRWHHERRVLDAGPGRCTVIDELAVSPRIGVVAPLTRRLVRAIFDHRHRRLRERFGGIDEADTDPAER